jgi:hypothetical protein
MTIHYIDVNQLSARLLDLANFIAKRRKIR